MTLSLADKARANRRAALATLNARIARGQNVVSIFDRVIQSRQAVPEFRSIRTDAAFAADTAPAYLLKNPLVA